MSVKSLIKTRWKIEPDRVTLYPNGLSYILCGVLAVIFAGLVFLFNMYNDAGLSGSLPFVIFLLFIVLLFWAHGNTYVVFDNRKRRMQKRLMGFIPVADIPFNELHGIQAVSNMAGGYNYRAFTRADRYGKGITVSSGYSKNNDPNAIALVETVIPIIHQYLGENAAPPENPISQQFTAYEYFNQEQGVYTLKRNKIGGTIIGLALFALGVYMLTDPPFFADLDGFRRGLVLLCLLILGPGLILAVFTRVVFDPQQQTVSRISPVGLSNRQYRFAEFTGFQTVRRTVNFIYSGTDVRMYFNPQGKTKQEVLILRSFRNTHKIERFVAEINQIMRVNRSGVNLEPAAKI